MSPHHFQHGRQRRGMILMIVVAMLALAAVIGIAFVYYAHQVAVNMRYYREAGQGGRSAGVNQGTFGGLDEAPPSPSEIANLAFGTLIYDTSDDVTGVYNGLRGYSFARAMYGLHYTGTTVAPTYGGNDIPYNGIGRFRATAAPYRIPDPALPANTDNYQLINYTYFPGTSAANDFMRDPERLGYRTGYRMAPPGQGGSNSWNIANNYYPVNAGYTYPDLNNLYLAAMRARDGQVLVPSFHRPWLFGPLAPNNPNWTNAVGKYLTLRPRPADHVFNNTTEFPYPADSTGDVKNLEGVPGGNDSLWMDLDLPVRKWRGKYYKPLVAFLIVDLDGRINVNVAGNLKGPGGTQSSNQGWGRSEMALTGILDQVTGNLSASSLILRARYGTPAAPTEVFRPDGNPANVGSYPTGSAAPFYGFPDFDSAQVNAAPNLRMALPSGLQTSPAFPAGRYDGGSAGERALHHLLYNPYLLSQLPPPTNQPAQDRAFGPSEMRYLNHTFDGDPTTYRLAELGRLLPNDLGRNFMGSGWSANPRFLMTTISNDLNRVGLAPWLKNVPSGDPRRFSYTQAQATAGTQPLVAQSPFPDLAQRTVAPSGLDDFDLPTWKSSKSPFGAIDINRKLADYRADPNQPYELANNVTAASYGRALLERQRFAKDIFDRLCFTMGAEFNQAVYPAVGTTEYNGLRWLAQLAVNMVDYLDNDDYMTPFVWHPLNAADPQNALNFGPAELRNRVVFGTELPRLVINESCIRVENGLNVAGQPDTDPGLVPDPNDPNWMPRATFFLTKAWVELMNPLNPTSAPQALLAPTLSHAGGAPLRHNGVDVYRLLLTQFPNNQLRNVDNVDGRNDATLHPNNGAGNPGIPVSLPNGPYVNGVIPPSNNTYAPGNNAASNIYCIGPNALPSEPNATMSAPSNNMKFRIGLNGHPNEARTTVMLQRLACPHLPVGPSNPYITVDFVNFEAGQVNDGRTHTGAGAIPANQLVPVTQNASWGRQQPYAGHPSHLARQNPNPPNALGMQHTFFRHNGRSATLPAAGDATLMQPFDWLVHLDRSLTSPIELLNVSAYKPHELTHQFIIQGTRYQQLGNWRSNTHRLYRLFSMLETRDRSFGVGHQGRIPGRININTVFDPQPFLGLADGNGANYFNPAALADTGNPANTATVFGKLLLSRDNQPAGPGFANGPTATSRPFLPIGAPNSSAATQYPTGVGFEDSILRPDPTSPRSYLFDTPVAGLGNASNVYLNSELLNKIYNNVTTRSNTFGVWMTVGYFEVRNQPPYSDTPTGRPKLGREIGIDDGTNIRHRFFAIVDRTNLSHDLTNARLQGNRPVFFSYEPVPQANGFDPNLTNATPVTPVTVTAMIPATSFNGGVLRGTYDGQAWEMRQNQQLIMDVGPNKQEVVIVQIQSFAANVGAQIQFACRQPHDRGCILQLNTATLGNPGPQPGFNYKDPRYAPVVPFVTQIN